MLKRLVKKTELSKKDALFTATQLVDHGFEEAASFIAKLSPTFKTSSAQAYLGQLQRRFDALQSLSYRRQVLRDRKFMELLYDEERFVHVKGAKNPEKLLVVFATVFNNFDISNAMLSAFLLELGVSFLILKDCSSYGYLKGAKSLGANPLEISHEVERIAERLGASQIFFTGFSSSSYASLYVSYTASCDGYLGFSAVTDLSSGSKCLPPKLFTPALRAEVDPSFLVNLRQLAPAEKRCARRVIYWGERSLIDGPHALNMQGVENFQLVKLVDCGHHTPSFLIENGSFKQALRKLLDLREDDPGKV